MDCNHTEPAAQPQGRNERPIGAPIIRKRRMYGGPELAEVWEDIAKATAALQEALAQSREQKARQAYRTIADEMLSDEPCYPQPRESGSRSNANNSSTEAKTRPFQYSTDVWPSDAFHLDNTTTVRKRKLSRDRRPHEKYTDDWTIQTAAQGDELSSKRGRVDRAKLLDGVRRITHRRTRNCHRNPIGSDPVQLIHRDDGQCRIVGLETCSSVHVCPICAAKICAGRADEATTAATLWRSMGNQTYLLTLTIRHDKRSRLRPMLVGLSESWAALWEGSSGVALRRGLGLRHYIRAFECTYADFPNNGWHPHLHSLLFLDHELAESERVELHARIKERWKDIVRRKLGPEHVPEVLRMIDGIMVADDSHAVDLKISTDAGYIVKLGLEVANIVSKTGRSSDHRTTWQIAEDAAKGNEHSVKLWKQWDDCSLGRRQLTWSRDTKKTFRVIDRTDEQLCLFTEEQLAAGPCYLLGLYEAREWRRLAFKHRYWLTRVICALQADSASSEVAELPGEQLPLERAGPGFIPATGFTRKSERFKTAPNRPARYDTPERLFELRSARESLQ